MSEDLIAVFQEELAELLESLERGLIDLQTSPEDDGLINQVFRDLHTIKGSGAMFGFTDLAQFIHDFETAFDKVRAGDVPVTSDLIRLCLSARDEIPGLVEGTEDPEGNRVGILNALRVLTSGEAPEADAQDAEDVADAEVVDADALDLSDLAAPEGGAAASVLKFRLSEEALMLGARPDVIIKELRGLGATEITPDLTHLPPLSEMEADTCYVAWQMLLPPEVTREQADDVFMFADAEWMLDVAQAEETVDDAAETAPEDVAASPKDAPANVVPTAPVKATAVAKATPKAVATQSAAPDAAKQQISEPAASIRVPATRLDALMDSVGELVTVEARLTELARQSRDPAMMATAEEITRLAARLRDATMTMRMVQMRTLVSRFRRLIHGLSDDLGKPVDFVVEGEDTELDKTVIEKLADPLVHVLRNAIDHGMEMPEDRLAAGKDAKGQITLSAIHAGGEVHITVEDNGKGIDPAVIRAKAIERGLISAEAQLTDGQIFNLVMEPGFSTAETVTELSGRGVGMDVVRRTIESLRGAIDIDSQLGKGTTVRLRLPLTLAIIDGLLIEVAGERYTLPMSTVQEIFELPREKRGTSRNGDYLDIRGQFVPFVRLRRLFSCEGEAPTAQNVVVVEAKDSRIGVVVDRIIGTNQTVIKQVSKLQRAARAISGATILGDGSVSLIIDVPQLVAATAPAPEAKKEAAA